MILYVLLLLATTALALRVYKPEKIVTAGYNRQLFANRVCMCGIFLMLFGVSAARYFVGNDYSKYREHFYYIWIDYIVPTESGFNKSVKLMEILFGETSYTFFFAVFAFVTILLMLRAIYTLSEEFALSFFLFMALGYYYQTMNTVRYYFVMAIVLCAIPSLFRKRYFRFIVFILLSALFHKSVLVVIPIYLLANCTWRKWQTAILCAVAASGLFLGDFYQKILLKLYPSYTTDTWLGYLDGGTSYVNIARCVLVIGFCAFFYQKAVKGDRQLLFYFRLNVAALMLYLCGSFIPEISRIGTYMTVTQIFLVPGVFHKLEDGKKKKWLTALLVAFGILYFAMFLVQAKGQLVKLLPYKTWLF